MAAVADTVLVKPQVKLTVPAGSPFGAKQIVTKSMTILGPAQLQHSLTPV